MKASSLTAEMFARKGCLYLPNPYPLNLPEGSAAMRSMLGQTQRFGKFRSAILVTVLTAALVLGIDTPTRETLKTVSTMSASSVPGKQIPIRTLVEDNTFIAQQLTIGGQQFIVVNKKKDGLAQNSGDQQNGLTQISGGEQTTNWQIVNLHFWNQHTNRPGYTDAVPLGYPILIGAGEQPREISIMNEKGESVKLPLSYDPKDAPTEVRSEEIELGTTEMIVHGQIEKINLGKAKLHIVWYAGAEYLSFYREYWVAGSPGTFEARLRFIKCGEIGGNTFITEDMGHVSSGQRPVIAHRLKPGEKISYIAMRGLNQGQEFNQIPVAIDRRDPCKSRQV